MSTGDFLLVINTNLHPLCYRLLQRSYLHFWKEHLSLLHSFGKNPYKNPYTHDHEIWRQELETSSCRTVHRA